MERIKNEKDNLIESLNTQNENLKIENGIQIDKTQRLESKLEEKENEIKQLHEKISKLEKEIKVKQKNAHATMKQQSYEIHGLKHQLEGMQNELEKLKASKEEIVATLEDKLTTIQNAHKSDIEKFIEMHNEQTKMHQADVQKILQYQREHGNMLTKLMQTNKDRASSTLVTQNQKETDFQMKLKDVQSVNFPMNSSNGQNFGKGQKARKNLGITGLGRKMPN